MITPALLRSWGACWADDRISEYFAGRAEITPRQIATDETVSPEDRLWVLTRALARLDESAARLYAVECAATATHLAGDEDDQAQHAGILASLIEAEDLPGRERAAARDAARDAALDAARNAARGAAWNAAWDAAWGAAWAAALDAARAAARGAARAAALAAALDASLDAARGAAWGAVRDEAILDAIRRALEWLGYYADGWEENDAGVGVVSWLPGRGKEAP